ncbi:AF4/FMR2 family member 1 isoform X1 [Corythoichthys intestinalis]|uniref:AF4/FMR2 family member 1 isoform X1 n=2 Tax=Corythoichthys intestinalis TaxID=161448 RepID=UPI0025A678FC|nr:AF4/FMR2 family member 1 isoform X1 [Corythoichthys intestinalis]
MASQPSIYDERNRLRLRAWEQRNQETSQAKELWAENVPLFGHPYKINKGDELSHRIQRMLGSFEDADNPATSPANFTQSDRGRPNSDRSDKPPVLDSDGQISSRNFSCSSYVFQATREKKPSSPNHRGSVKSSLDQHKQVETLSDWVENARSPQERVTRSPDGWPIVFPNPSEPVGATDRFEPRRESASTSATADISAINPKHSPADPSPYQAGKSGHSLLSQSFPPLSSSKPPSVVAMQKPTAYVRPMDGQDLLLGGSPNLKPSTEPHVPLQEILKPERAKTKMLETKANEGVCVQAILKEMTHSWPPLLTAIHIPNSDGCLTKEVGQVSSCPGGQKSHQHSPGHLDTQSSSLSCYGHIALCCSSHKEAHSSGAESASSGDSDGSWRSESDGESVVNEPGGPPAAGSKTECEAVASRSDWQLGNWIPSGQKNQSRGVGDVFCENSGRQRQPGFKALPAEAGRPTERGGNPPKVRPRGRSSHWRSPNGAGGLMLSEDGVECAEDLAGKVAPFSDRPKVKMKTGRPKNAKKSERTFERADAQKTESGPEVARREAKRQSRPIPTDTPPVVIGGSKADEGAKTIPKAPSRREMSGDVLKSFRDVRAVLARCLLVKIDLGLLSRIPQVTPERAGTRKHPKASDAALPQIVKTDDKALPRKKRKVEKKPMTSSDKDSSVQVENGTARSEDQQHDKAKKKRLDLQKTPNNTGKDPKARKGSRAAEPRKDTLKRKGSSEHESRRAKRANTEKLPSVRPSREIKTSRALLKSEERRYPVKHYIKEAKRLKHKADAESDKRSKAFNYLDAVMFFVESGIVMEKDPQISTSSYTMFAETVELLKFVLKLVNSTDMTAPPQQKDFVALCLKCLSLLQMAMFRHKRNTALKYSKTLSEHFDNPALESSVHNIKGPHTPSLIPGVPSPACGGNGGAVTVPVAVEQMTVSYVNITTLFLNAQEMWEQAEQMARKGSGLVAELDAAVGPLSLTCSVSSMVRYTQQGMAWLRLDNNEA